MSDLDWMGSDFGVLVDAPELIQPPRLGLILTAVVALVSLGMAFVNPRIGYIVAILASSLGGFTAVADQRKRADSNYVTHSWFMPALRTARYFALLVAVINISVLAVEVARGGRLL